jgi:hypothetical protein
MPLPIALSAPAPEGGVTITLNSDRPLIATVTPSVLIAGGAMAPAAQPQVSCLSAGSVIINAAAPDFGEASVYLTCK